MRHAIPGLAILLFFSSCSDNSKSEDQVHKMIDEGMSLFSTRINQHTANQYRSLEYKVEDPRTHFQAIIWEPRAVHIKTLTSEMISYIETLKNDLKKEAGLKTTGDKEVYAKDNTEAVRLVFDKKNKGKELFKKLEQYKEDMLGIEERMKKAFQNNIVLTTKSFGSANQSSENFVSYFFKGITVDAALSTLNIFESNVKVMENDFATYCNVQVTNTFDGYDVFSAIVGQSSNYVKAGDKIMLTAGVGAFSVASKPKVTIDRKGIELNPDGVAIYEFKTPVKAGKYFKSVKVEYTKPDGNKETKNFNIDYTVIEPNQE
jgi:GldM N-terminal domain